MTYRIEVLLRTYHILRGDEETWRPMHAVGKEPYTWRTLREAEAMLDLCFPDKHLRHRVRIVEIPAEVT